MIAFVKMHGLGNDFVIFDHKSNEKLSLTEARVRHLCDRRLGIGCDQLIVLEPSSDPSIDRVISFYNADGSQAGACGNGTRCIVRLLHEETGRDEFKLKSSSRVIEGKYNGHGDVEVDMGKPNTDWQAIPLSQEEDTLKLPIEGEPACVSMGNPHGTYFVNHFSPSLMGLGCSEIERFFPQGVNTGFARILNPHKMRLKVHERGAGFTSACGTGACAAVVNGVRRGLVERQCEVEMDGGLLHINWSKDNDHVYLRGATFIAFWGEIPMENYHS